MSRATNEMIGRGLEKGLNNFVAGYVKRKETESAEEVLNSPSSTPVQKAIAWEKLSPGSGPKTIESNLREQQLLKQEQQDNQIRGMLHPNQGGTPPINDPGQRAEVGALPNISPKYSPVDMANQNLPLQGSNFQAPEVPQGTQEDVEEMRSPAAKALKEFDQIERTKNQPNQPETIGNMPIEKLQQLLGQTKSPEIVREIQSEMARRNTLEKNKGRLEAAKVANNAQIEKEDRADIRTYAKPYENVQSLEKNVRNMEEAEKIVNSGKYNFSETWLRGIASAIINGEKGEKLTELLQTSEQQKMFSLLKDSLKPKEIGGSNPSTKEVMIALSALTSPYKGKAANAFIVNNLVKNAKIDLEKGKAIQAYRQIPGQTYSEFLEKVNEHVGEKSQEFEQQANRNVEVANAYEMVKDKTPPAGYVFMMNQNGDIKSIPGNQVQTYEAQGAIRIK